MSSRTFSLPVVCTENRNPNTCFISAAIADWLALAALVRGVWMSKMLVFC